MSSVSKSQMNSTNSLHCTDSANNEHVACLSVQEPTDLLSPAVDSLMTECDSLAGIIQNNVISSLCKSRREGCCSGADCETSSETSSTELSCDTGTVIPCSHSYSVL